MGKGVSAEFGGYRVAAGLGGGEGGGSIFARAEAPGAGAGAGLYGGGAGAGAGASSGYDGPQGPPSQGGGFFDRIFAVSVL